MSVIYLKIVHLYYILTLGIWAGWAGSNTKASTLGVVTRKVTLIKLDSETQDHSLTRVSLGLSRA